VCVYFIFLLKSFEPELADEHKICPIVSYLVLRIETCKKKMANKRVRKWNHFWNFKNLYLFSFNNLAVSKEFSSSFR